ncbi:TPA: exodeoxyribonuclease VII large subunit [Candidatus Bipolaricaulota bacterium]|nr:exodeoxyribonuclease VII large subunit [Candidatus Bipolaricaulota bacterium]
MAKREVAYDSGDLLRIRFEYDRRLVDLVKGLPERRWDGARRCWVVPAQHVVAVVELLQGEGFTFDDATLRMYARAKDQLQHLTVSQLNLQVKSAIQKAFPNLVWLVGEISGLERARRRTQQRASQLLHFQLVEKNEQGQVISRVEAVLTGEDRLRVEEKLARAGDPFRLEDEVTVRVLVQVDIFVPWGAYRVLVKDLDISYTLGEVARRREEIIRRLTKEGLIDRNKSLPFPLVPLRVGLITSLGSDAERDVLKTLRESGFAFQVTVHGARVQGPYTEPSVLNALDWFRAHAGEFDVVLICRGGGSRTDLAWFDSEALGRAVATFPLPVVVGIGHEEDFSVLDHVGRRAKTPTAAAQLLVQRVQESLARLEESLGRVLSHADRALSEARKAHGERVRRLNLAAAGKLAEAWRDLGRLSRTLPRVAGVALGRGRQYLVLAQERLVRSVTRELQGAEEALASAADRLVPRSLALLAREGQRLSDREKRLWALDPRRVVERGYAILRLTGGGVVTDPREAPVGTKLRAEIKRGVLKLVSEGGEEGHGTA